MIEVSHLTKRYGPNAAVDDLSFSVEQGQIYGFLGPNGAGKSTTMNILTGYIAPTAGTVTINGHNILEEPEEARKCIGYLPEIPPVYPEMSVLEYLTFAAELKKLPKKEKDDMVEAAMKSTGLTQMKGRLIRNLSKGYRQRVGLAQAILGLPEIIILDEPMVGLDPKQIIEIRELIRSLAKQHTVILSSHILSEISAICDHIMIIAHGKLVASDTPENLLKLMKGSGSLELTIRANRTLIQQMFAPLSGVSGLDIKKSQEPESCDVIVKTEGEEDLREPIFNLCAERHAPILRMQHVHVSLEDIFLELTEDHPQQRQKPKKKRFAFGRAAKDAKEAQEAYEREVAAMQEAPENIFDMDGSQGFGGEETSGESSSQAEQPERTVLWESGSETVSSQDSQEKEADGHEGDL